MNYTQIPSLSQWQKDSSVALAVRKTDVVLARIDTLLELYTAAAGDDAALGAGEGRSVTADLGRRHRNKSIASRPGLHLLA